MRKFGLVLACVALGLSGAAGAASSPRTFKAAPRQPAPFATQTPTVTYKSLYAFKNPPDGATPNSPLIDVNGELYGTTSSGGTANDGTVFEISTSGSEHVIYSFKGKPDGAQPVGLSLVNGMLYGATANGGSGGNGTVFALSPSGTESVLYSFKGGTSDGANPYAPPTGLGGVLYGTTSSGGAQETGTIYALTTTGAERVLHSFGPEPDGLNPQGPLTVLNGELYGTTSQGGSPGNYPTGTVFEVTTAGAERVLHTFQYYGSPRGDGLDPNGTLTASDGKLLGTTQGGGTGRGIDLGGGTVFEISTSGAERVLYSFGSYAGDGYLPQSGVSIVNGVAYGETALGGFGVYPGGTIFEVSASGLERVIYTLEQSNSAADFMNGFTVANGILYGTTAYGGRFGYKNGTVFKLSL